MLCQIVSGGQGFDIKVKSLNLIIKDERYLIDNTNYGSPCISIVGSDKSRKKSKLRERAN